MKFWKRLNNRGRILMLLLMSLVLLNVIVVVTTYNLKSFSGSISSMLNDRLVPSTEIAHIQELCYVNRLSLEGLLYNDNKEYRPEVLGEINRMMDSTFVKYKNTYFTEEESMHAMEFQKALQQYREYEQEILVLLQNKNMKEAESLFKEGSKQAFQSMIQELHLLSGIQIVAGRLLYQDADTKIKSIKLVAYLSLCISMVVALQLLKVLGIKPF